ncbi:hypothetical protein ACL6C3_16790 [Capilliphycus salinus ALCB114379]|uniref:hypothetical protein n=1 Tax=Capilliphycus salinus TaxID=2768948 RepID=UPI0039A5D7B2
MIEKFFQQLTRITDAIVQIAKQMEEGVKQLNHIRITLLKIENALMNLDCKLEGPDDLENNPLEPESEIINGGKN